jgi:hypothetical protein
MEDVPTPASITDGRELKEVLASFDGPAFLRRARRVQEALDGLLARGRHQRREWLVVTTILVGQLEALADGWDNLRPLLADDAQLDVLRRLKAELQPSLRAPPEPTTSTWAHLGCLRELIDCLHFFNGRWGHYLDTLDLGPINELRAGYNRHYVFEKECAVGSPAVARQNFRPLEPLTRADLDVLLPPLPVPVLK